VVVRAKMAGADDAQWHALGFTPYMDPMENTVGFFGNIISRNPVAYFWTAPDSGVDDTTSLFSQSGPPRDNQREHTDTPGFKARQLQWQWQWQWQNTGDAAAQRNTGIPAKPSRDRGHLDGGRSEAVNAVQRLGDVGANYPGAIKVGSVTFPGAAGPVGEDGRPVRVYHGTKYDFTALDTDHNNRLEKGWLGRGVYATSSSELADKHAENVKRLGNIEAKHHAAVYDGQVPLCRQRRRQAAAKKFLSGGQ
jgi:hypothetical protein